MNVLVCVDDVSLSTALVDELAAAGCKATTVRSVGEALNVLQRESVDVLFAERRTSLVNRASSLSPKTRVIWIAARPTVRDYREAVEQGIAFVLTKPFTTVQFRQALLQTIDHGVSLQGIADGLPLTDILQLFHFSRHSLVLAIEPGNRRIWLREGEIVHATCDQLRGRAALAALITDEAGGVRTLAAQDVSRTINEPFEQLLRDLMAGEHDGRPNGRPMAAAPDAAPPPGMPPGAMPESAFSDATPAFPIPPSVLDLSGPAPPSQPNEESSAPVPISVQQALAASDTSRHHSRRFYLWGLAIGVGLGLLVSIVFLLLQREDAPPIPPTASPAGREGVATEPGKPAVATPTIDKTTLQEPPSKTADVQTEVPAGHPPTNQGSRAAGRSGTSKATRGRTRRRARAGRRAASVRRPRATVAAPQQAQATAAAAPPGEAKGPADGTPTPQKRAPRVGLLADSDFLPAVDKEDKTAEFKEDVELKTIDE